MSAIILAAGEKGGAGKSFLAKTLTQWHLDNDIPLMGFEADRSNPDYLRCYKSVLKIQPAIFSEGEKYEDKANVIYNAAIKKRVLVNLPAQVMKPVSNWILGNELFEIAQEDDISFQHWFVSDGGYDSINLFKKSLELFGHNMTHLFVKNAGRCDDWSGVEEDEELQTLFAEFNVIIVEFPKLIGTAGRNQIDRESLSFGKAREWKKFNSISRQRVKRFLREAYAAFDATGILASESEEVTV